MKKLEVMAQNLGIDVSKDSLEVVFGQLYEDRTWKVRGSRKFSNKAKDFASLLDWVQQKRQPDLALDVTLEATGVYYEELAYYLHEQGCQVHVVLPNKAKSFAQSLNLKSKNDASDARMLAQMGLERRLEVWRPQSPQMRALKQLSRERTSLLEERTALLNRQHALQHSYEPCDQSLKRLQERLDLLEQQLKDLEAQLRQVLQADAALQQKIEQICVLKGLGTATVLTIVAETNGFELFTSRAQLTSYAGYDVVQNASGSSQKGKTRISKKGNHHIRRALHFPAISVVKHDAAFQRFFQRLLQRTPYKMKAYVAVQRKLLGLIFTLFKKGQPYDPDFYQQKGRQDALPAYAG